jgi:hypothetical protein
MRTKRRATSFPIPVLLPVTRTTLLECSFAEAAGREMSMGGELMRPRSCKLLAIGMLYKTQRTRKGQKKTVWREVSIFLSR